MATSEVDRAFYSVPNHLLGCEVGVHWDDRVVKVFFQEQQVGLSTIIGKRSFLNNGRG